MFLKGKLCRKIHSEMEASAPHAHLEMKQDFVLYFRIVHFHRFLTQHNYNFTFCFEMTF